MRIIKKRSTSKCKDDSLVKEYVLISPVDDQDINTLEKYGEVSLKGIGENILYSFSSDILSVKGMIGDTVIYVTHRREDDLAVKNMMENIFG